MEGVAYRPFRMGVADGLGDFLVGTGLPVRDSPGGFQHLGLKFRTVDLDRNGELLDFTCQIQVQFSPGLLIDLGVSAADLAFGLGLGIGACLETAGSLATLKPKPAEFDSVKDKSPLAPHVAVVDLNKSGIVEIHPINIYPCRQGAKLVAHESVKLLYYAR